jgi:hypothetical protein
VLASTPQKPASPAFRSTYVGKSGLDSRQVSDVRSAPALWTSKTSNNLPTLRLVDGMTSCVCAALSKRTRTSYGHVPSPPLARFFANLDCRGQCAAGCGSGQIHDGGVQQPIVKCAVCASKTCFSCKVPWHADMTCDEWTLSRPPTSTSDEASTEILLRRARELRASKETIERTTKPCPKCKWNIEKNGGWYVFRIRHGRCMSTH